MRATICLLGVSVLPLVASSASAQSLTCGPAEAGTVQIDGLLDDWRGVPTVTVGGDPGVSIACNTEGKSLLFVIHVTDGRFVRTQKNAPGEDHVELVVGGKRLLVYPGDANKIKDRVLLGGKPVPKTVKSASSLQRDGWAVELALPAAALGFRSFNAALPYELVVSDCDSLANLKTEQTARVSGELQFADAAASVSAFLDERGLQDRDVWFDKPVRLGGKSEGRMLGAGKYLAVITDGYVYRELPISEKRDVKEVKLLDLAGDGNEALVVRYLEHGSGNAVRELLAIYRYRAEVDRVFVAEVGRSVDKMALQSKVSWVKRGKAWDLLLEAGTAQGFTAETLREWGGEEIVNLAVPWGPPEDKKQRYQFTSSEYRRQ